MRPRFTKINVKEWSIIINIIIIISEGSVWLFVPMCFSRRLWKQVSVIEEIFSTSRQENVGARSGIMYPETIMYPDPPVALFIYLLDLMS